MRESIARLAPSQDCPPGMARVLAFFDALDEWFRSDGFNGCTFINASAEYPRRDGPIHVAGANHKNRWFNLSRSYWAGYRWPDSHLVATQIALLADGSISIPIR